MKSAILAVLLLFSVTGQAKDDCLTVDYLDSYIHDKSSSVVVAYETKDSNAVSYAMDILEFRSADQVRIYIQQIIDRAMVVFYRGGCVIDDVGRSVGSTRNLVVFVMDIKQASDLAESMKRAAAHGRI